MDDARLDALVSVSRRKAWDALLHPRDPKGRWADKAHEVAKLAEHERAPEAAAELRKAAHAMRTADLGRALIHLDRAEKAARAAGKHNHAKTITALRAEVEKHRADESQQINPGVADLMAAVAKQFGATEKKKGGAMSGTAKQLGMFALRGGDDRLGALVSISRLAGTRPEPIGKPGGPGIWGTGKQLPSLFQHVRNDLMESGHPKDQAHRMAYGIIRNWAAGHDGKGNKVSAATVAEAQKCMAQLEKLRAEAKATRSTDMGEAEYDRDGLSREWDGPLDDLPDLAGLGVADLDAAATEGSGFGDWADDGPPGVPDATRAKLGTGARFRALAAELEAKGVRDPDALAAKIGRKKYGKAKFAGLAARARKAAPKPEPAAAARAAAIRPGELFRLWPLEECRIMRAAEGREYESGRVVEAYAAVFNQRAEIRDHEGHYQEEVDSAAFDDVLRAVRPEANRGKWRVKCLYNHGMTVHGTPAERFSLPAGVPQHISAEGKGLMTRTEYAPTPLGDELLTLVDMGALDAQSFTGGIIRSNPMLRGPGDRYRRLPGGALQLVRRLVLGLREYGLTPFAAYTGAEVLGVRMQLPGGLTEPPGEYDQVGQYEDHEDAAAPTGDGGGHGDPPGDGDASRSTGNRLYRLRTEELLRQHGITLP